MGEKSPRGTWVAWNSCTHTRTHTHKIKLKTSFKYSLRSNLKTNDFFSFTSWTVSGDEGEGKIYIYMYISLSNILASRRY